MFLKGFLRDNSGISSIQYGLFGSMIGLGIIGSVQSVSTESSNTYGSVAYSLSAEGTLMVGEDTRENWVERARAATRGMEPA